MKAEEQGETEAALRTLLRTEVRAPDKLAEGVLARVQQLDRQRRWVRWQAVAAGLVLAALLGGAWRWQQERRQALEASREQAQQQLALAMQITGDTVEAVLRHSLRNALSQAQATAKAKEQQP